MNIALANKSGMLDVRNNMESVEARTDGFQALTETLNVITQTVTRHETTPIEHDEALHRAHVRMDAHEAVMEQLHEEVVAQRSASRGRPDSQGGTEGDEDSSGRPSPRGPAHRPGKQHVAGRSRSRDATCTVRHAAFACCRARFAAAAVGRTPR